MGIQNNVHVIDNSRIDFTRGLRERPDPHFPIFLNSPFRENNRNFAFVNFSTENIFEIFMVERGRYCSHAQFEQKLQPRVGHDFLYMGGRMTIAYEFFSLLSKTSYFRALLA